MINVLFVCVGNSCRSQMAEGFGRKYGADVMNVWSAGLAPAPIVQPPTIQVMLEKNIDIQDQFPKSVEELELNSFDIVVNMAGMPLSTSVRGETRVWKVTDPMAQPEDVYVRVRDQIEGLVMQLILDLRRSNVKSSIGTPPKPSRNPVSTPQPTTTTNLDRTSESSQRFGFGRVRKSRD